MSDKLPSIFLGHDFYTKPRNRKWIADHGAEAVIILQTIWLASSQERNCKIEKSAVHFLPFPIPFTKEKIDEVLTSAVEVGLLDESGDFFFNSQIVNDDKSFKVKRENYRKGRQKRDEIKGESSENPPRIQTQTSENHIEYEYEYEYEEKKKGEPPKPPSKYSEVVYTPERVIITPNDFSRDHIKAKLKDYGLLKYYTEALEQLALYYHKDPSRIKTGCLYRDITASWLRKILYEEKASRKKAERGEAPASPAQQPFKDPQTPKPKPLSEEDREKARALIRERFPEAYKGEKAA